METLQTPDPRYLSRCRSDVFCQGIYGLANSPSIERETVKILGIETSCDDTGLAIYDSECGIIANRLHTQIDLHALYGGVVPELSSRDHVRKVVPLLDSALQEAGIQFADLDGIAYTAGPGLIGALMVGATFARSLAWASQKPSVAV